MKDSTSKETHFRYDQPHHLHRLNVPSLPSQHPIFTTNTNPDRLVITSEAFKSKMQPARHRMVYALLRDEMALEGGIHALQLRTLTPEEEERQQKKKAAEAAAKEEQPKEG